MNTYIDPKMLDEHRLVLPDDGKGEYALINCSIRGKGKVTIMKGAALAWVDINLEEGEELVIGEGWYWVVGNTTKGGRLEHSGEDAMRHNGMLVKYFHPNDRPLNSRGGEVLKTMWGYSKSKGTHVKVVLRDNMWMAPNQYSDRAFIDSDAELAARTADAKKENKPLPGDPKLGEGDVKYYFSEWRYRAGYPQMIEEYLDLLKSIEARTRSVVSEATLEGIAIRISQGNGSEGGQNLGFLVQPVRTNGDVTWYWKTLLVGTQNELKLNRIPGDGARAVIPEAGTHTYLASWKINFRPTKGDTGELTERPILEITMTKDGREYKFAVSEDHPRYKDTTVVAYNGDHPLGRDGAWEQIGPALESGPVLSFKSRHVDAGAIASPKHPHVSAIQKLTYLPSGRDYARADDIESIENEANYILINAAGADLFESKDGPVLRTLSRIYEPLIGRQDIPRIMAWPLGANTSTVGLTLLEQITLVENGLSRLLGKKVNLNEIVTHIIVPEWSLSGERIRVRSDEVDQILKQKGIRVMRTSFLGENKGQASYVQGDKDTEGTIAYITHRIAEKYKRQLGWSSDAPAILLLDSMGGSRSAKLQELIAKVVAKGVRIGFTTMAPFAQISEQLGLAIAPPAGKAMLINADAASRIMTLAKNRPSSENENYQKDRTLSLETAIEVEALARRVVSEEYWDKAAGDTEGSFMQMLNRYYQEIGGVPVQIREPGVIREAIDESAQEFGRIKITGIPAAEHNLKLGPNGEWPTYNVEGASVKVPNVRAELIEKLQAALDDHFKDRPDIRLEVQGNDYNFISIVRKPELYHGKAGKAAFFEYLQLEHQMTNGRVLYVADAVSNPTSDAQAPVAIAATNRDQAKVPAPDQAHHAGPFAIGPKDEGYEYVLSLILETLDEIRAKDLSGPVQSTVVEILNSRFEKGELPGQRSVMPKPASLETIAPEADVPSLARDMVATGGVALVAAYMASLFTDSTIGANALLLTGAWAVAAGAVAGMTVGWTTPIATSNPSSSLFGTVSDRASFLPAFFMIPNRLEEASHFGLTMIESYFVPSAIGRLRSNEGASHIGTFLQLLTISVVLLAVLPAAVVFGAFGVFFAAALVQTDLALRNREQIQAAVMRANAVTNAVASDQSTSADLLPIPSLAVNEFGLNYAAARTVTGADFNRPARRAYAQTLAAGLDELNGNSSLDASSIFNSLLNLVTKLVRAASVPFESWLISESKQKGRFDAVLLIDETMTDSEIEKAVRAIANAQNQTDEFKGLAATSNDVLNEKVAKAAARFGASIVVRTDASVFSMLGDHSRVFMQNLKRLLKREKFSNKFRLIGPNGAEIVTGSVDVIYQLIRIREVNGVLRAIPIDDEMMKELLEGAKRAASHA